MIMMIFINIVVIIVGYIIGIALGLSLQLLWTISGMWAAAHKLCRERH